MKLEIVSGDRQTGIAGHTFAQPLVVRILDQTGQPVRGVVGFEPLGPGLEIDRDPDGEPYDDSRGVTSVRVRAAAGASGTAQVMAGIPGYAVKFTLTIQPPRIVPNRRDPSGTTVPPGEDLVYRFALSPDATWRTTSYRNPPGRPVVLKLAVTGGAASEPTLDVRKVAQWDQHDDWFHVTPTGNLSPASGAMGQGTMTVQASYPADGGVTPVAASVTIETPPHLRLVQFDASRSSPMLDPHSKRDPVRLHFVPAQGWDAIGQRELRAGERLPRAFRIRLIDDAGNDYTKEIVPPILTDCSPHRTRPLQVTWVASGGLVSVGQGPPQPQVVAEITESVQFTADATGYVLCRLVALVSASVPDPDARTFTHAWGDGTSRCYREPSFFVDRRWTFHLGTIPRASFHLADEAGRPLVGFQATIVRPDGSRGVYTTDGSGTIEILAGPSGTYVLEQIVGCAGWGVARTVDVR